MQMTAKDTFRVYLGNYIPGPGQPIVIITYDTQIGAKVRSEYFVFFEGTDADEKGYYEQSFEVEYNIPEIPVKIAHYDFITIQQEASLHAERAISSHLREYYKNITEPENIKQSYILKEADERHIIRLIVNNRYPDELHRIKEKSHSASLRKFLEDYSCVPKRMRR